MDATDYTKLTDDELRVQVAERIFEWEVVRPADEIRGPGNILDLRYRPRGIESKWIECLRVPDFARDYAAAFAVQAEMDTRGLHWHYAVYLIDIVLGEDDVYWTNKESINPTGVFAIASATPRQRVIAALMALDAAGDAGEVGR